MPETDNDSVISKKLGDTFLDNTMGSGTTNPACLKLNRKSIGIEKEKQYYVIGHLRNDVTLPYLA